MLNEQSRMEICNRPRLETEKRGDDFFWDKGIQKKDELLEECKFFVVVIDHAFECFVFEEKWRKIHWGYSFFHGNEIYRDLNKQDNRKRERTNG